MFNQELKIKFIQSYTHSINTATACEVLFKHFEPYEIRWNADLCTKTAQELQPAVDTIAGMRYRSQTTQLLILQKYIKWCVQNGVENAIDDTENISAPGVEKIRQKTVSSPYQLQKYLDTVYLPENMDTVDNTYRAFYWLAFGGMSEEDIFKVTADNIDFMNMRVIYNDNAYPIYGESVPCLMRCATAKEFTYVHPSYTTKRQRVDDPSLIRGIKGVNTPEAMRVHLSRRANEMIKSGKINSNISYYHAWLSGHFYRVYMAELRGIEPDFSYFINEFKERRLVKKQQTKANIKQVVLEYLRDYERWRFAHNL